MPYATHAGARIHYVVEGNGIPLVLHPGLMSTHAIFYQSGYVDALKVDYRLVMLDPRGHGASDKPRDPDAYRPAQRVADVLAVLDTLQLERAHYLGYSLGGRVGFDLGVQAPQRFLSLAIGGYHPFARDSQVTARLAAQLRQEGMAGYLAAAERANGPVSAERRERWLAQDAEAVAACWEALGAAPSLEADLSALTLPVLVYCGDQDSGHAEAQRATTLMPQATFLSLPGLDHGQAGDRIDLVIPHLQALHARVAAAAVSGF